MPANYDQVDNPDPSGRRGPRWTRTNDSDPNSPFYQYFQTGVMFYHSQLKLSRISDGTSSTYLIGEKYLTPDAYEPSGEGRNANNPAFSYGENQGRLLWLRVGQSTRSVESLPWHARPRYRRVSASTDTPGYKPDRPAALAVPILEGTTRRFAMGPSISSVTTSTLWSIAGRRTGSTARPSTVSEARSAPRGTLISVHHG